MSFVDEKLNPMMQWNKKTNQVLSFSFVNQTDYRVFIYGSGPFSGFLTVSGSLSVSVQIPIEVQGNSHAFLSKNLGLLKFLNLSCSFTSKVYVDFIIIRNEETGHIFRFQCNHWFGRNVDDDAMERILVANHVHDHEHIVDLIRKSQNRTSSIGRHFGRGIYFYDSRKEIPLEKLQLMLKERVEELIQCFPGDVNSHQDEDRLQVIIDSHGNTNQVNQSNGSQRETNDLLKSSSTNTLLKGGKQSESISDHHLQNLLLFSEPHGVIPLLMQCLYTGFRNRMRSPFRKQLFLWDYVLRIQMELKLSWKTLDSHLSSVKNDPNESPSRRKVASRSDRKFIEIVDNINSQAVFFGKDGKMSLLLTIALRDRFLSPHLIRLLSWPSLAKLFFDIPSFVSDHTLMMFLIQVMSKINQVDVAIDAAATKSL